MQLTADREPCNVRWQNRPWWYVL